MPVGNVSPKHLAESLDIEKRQIKLEKVAREITQCQACELRMNATCPVAGHGSVGAKYFLIGEAPGKAEDEAGIPFVGSAGRRLDKLLELANIDINDCYLSNVCRCRPPTNRDPKKKEIKTCVEFLWREIRLVKPKYIITLGSVPLSLFCPYGVRQMHGTMFEYKLEDICDSLSCSQESVDSGWDLKKHLLSHTKANIKQRTQDAETAWMLDGTSTKQVISVSGQTTTTSMPAKSTEDIGITSMKETSGKSTRKTSPTTTLLPQDFLAKVSQLLESEEDLKILEELCSSKYAELRKQSELRFCSLRMLKDYLITTGGRLSEKSSRRWMNWGMTANGKCLTARIMESHRTGRGCSLLDILEDNPDQKYFLSERQTQYILKSQPALMQTMEKDGLTTDREQ